MVMFCYSLVVERLVKMKDHEVRHKVIGTELFLAMHLSLILAVMKSIFCWISPVLAVKNPATYVPFAYLGNRVWNPKLDQLVASHGIV